ncbi:MAG TPA: hypothetical protein VNM90_13545 [Haliangium sp.]|nr:hypothetical protein [Haliangium sp.]
MHIESLTVPRVSVSHSWLAALAAASIGITGCGSSDTGAGPAEAQQRIQATVPGMSAALTQSMDRWAANETLTSLSTSMDTMELSFERLFPGFVSEEGDVAEPAPLARLLALEEGEAEADIGAEIEALAAVIFTEENHEGDGIYRIRGAAFCEIDGVVDAECAAQIDDMELRVRATAAGDGMDIGFRIGPDQDEPFVLELRSDRLSAVVDLADLKDAAVFLGGGEAEAELPAVMEGVVAFSLLVPSENEAEIQVGVRERIRFETDSSGTGPAMKFETEARDPVYSVHMTETSLTMAVDVGRTRVTGPWSEIQGDGVEAGDLDIDWQGLTYEVDLTAGSDTLDVRNIGLGAGTSIVKLDGKTLLSVDLNKDSGRQFDVALSLDEAGLPLLAVAPGIDLQVSYDLQPLADAGVLIDAPLLTSSYSFAVRGEKPSLQPIDADLITGFPGGVRVVSGEIAISAEGAADVLIVPAGKCLVETIPAIDAHPLMGALAAVDCP